jgi:hypothetical protein
MIRIDVHPIGENRTIWHTHTCRQAMYVNVSQNSYESEIALLHQRWNLGSHWDRTAQPSSRASSFSLTYVNLVVVLIVRASRRGCSHETWWLTWNKVRHCLVRLNRLLFSSKQQRRAKQLSKTKKTSKCEKEKCLIDCLLHFGAYTLTLFIELDSYLFTTL